MRRKAAGNQLSWPYPRDLLAIICTCGTLERHLEVHMSDLSFNNDEWLAKLNSHLDAERYGVGTVSQYIAVARQFLADLNRQRVAITAAQPENVERYLQRKAWMYPLRHEHSPDYRHWRRTAIHMLLRVVQGQWPPVSPSITPAEVSQQVICEEYSRWMIGSRGLAQTTVLCRSNEVSRFLAWLGERAILEKLSILTPLDVDAYMKGRASSLRRISLKDVAGKMRSFLRWLYTTKRTTRDLSSTVIAPSIYAHEGIPCAIGTEDLKKVLAVTQGDHRAKGLRDYAILMLLSTYGVRAREIVSLRLDDVDWRKEVIRIRHSKTGATSYLPLMPEVGDAVLQYLQKSRPKTHFREVFIRCKAPFRPFTGSTGLHGLVHARLAAAGLNTTGKHGPHIFRHARAVSLLRAAVPMKQIGDLLGHRSADSTLAYLKLATEDLRSVAMEIPTGVKA
jgi:integrase/recombinase XerD